MPASFVYDAVRTPFRAPRQGLRRRPPRRSGGHRHGIRRRAHRNRPRAHRRRDLRRREPGGRRQPQRRALRCAEAGFPSSVPGTTIKRLCGSSLDAVIQGSRAIEAGDADVILAGGVESMTRAPFVVEKSPRPFPAANQTMWNTSIGWRMTNPRLRADWTISNGESAEKSPRSTTSRVSSRTLSPPAATVSLPRPWQRDASTTRSCRSKATRSRATRVSATIRPPRCSRPSDPHSRRTARSRRETLTHQRRRLGCAAGGGGDPGYRAPRAHRGSGRVR